MPGQIFSLWSIRAAGDVNGNGVDDVALTLAPQGPAYVQTSNGEPTALMSVLVDGSLFKLDSATNSFRLDQLKTPLNPYNRSQLYDVASTSTSDYYPGLQNWFDPILSFTPGALTSVSTGTSTNPDSAKSYSPPAAVVGPQGQIYLFFSGEDDSGTNNASGLWMAYQDSSGNWQQQSLSVASSCNRSTPSASYYDGKLYVAFADTSGDIHIAVCSGSPEQSSNWTSYQVITTVDEATAYSPTLIAENGRLALYFPTNNNTGYGTNYEYLRYLYSVDPSNTSNNGEWGSSYNSATGQYSGISGQLNYEVTSPIAATTFQGRTVLAYRSYNTGFGYNVGNGDIQLLTQVASQPTSSDPTSSISWVSSTTSVDNINGVGLTTDQSLLYLTSSTGYGNNNGTSVIWSLNPTLNTVGQADGTWTMANQASWSGPSVWNQAYVNGSEQQYSVATVNPFMLNGQLMGTWTDSNKNVQIASLAATVDSPSQASLAGYSIDGNIDINGDGLKDLLISDPSDPSKSVDNQYALFGGDYLNIASQVGTQGNDVVQGTSLADVIYTLQGADQVNSLGGADVIYTGAGDDQVSIIDNAFIRIDAGSGFDALMLEGNVNQSYDFRLNLSNPEYFAGTKLRDFELINSQDFGSNTLYFDAEAINTINPDRTLFLTSDSTDIILLSSEFNRNRSYDTTYGGTLWKAYAAAPADAQPDTDSPALIYVSNTETTVEKLDPSAKTSTPRLTSAAEPQLPLPSTLAGPAQLFGNGFSLQAYRATTGATEVRYTISRASSDIRQVIAYRSTTENSTADPGLHYDAIAGILPFEKGVTSLDITIPIDSKAFQQLRGGKVSLVAEELPEHGQQALHLVVNNGANADDPTAEASTLSGFALTPTDDQRQFLLQFRTDCSTPAPAPAAMAMAMAPAPAAAAAPASAAPLSLYRRTAADAALRDAGTLQSLLHTTDNGRDGLDLDGQANQQVSLEFLLNTATAAHAVSRITSAGEAIPIGVLGRQATLEPPSLSPLSSPETVDYEAINSGLVDFSSITPDQYKLIDWGLADFAAIATSAASAASLDYGLINYSQFDSAEEFAALATTIQYDEITGRHLAAIAANPLSQDSFRVVIGDKGETMRQRGSSLNDLFRVRSGGRLIASGGDGADFYFSNTKNFKMVIKDLAAGDHISLAKFTDHDLSTGRLDILQKGSTAIVAFQGHSLVKLLNTDSTNLIFDNGNLFLQPQPITPPV